MEHRNEQAAIARGAASSTRRQFISGLGGSLAATQMPAQPQAPEDLLLWYREPAAKWTDALPIGNGRLGAMVFGGIQMERLQLNEDSLWSASSRDWNNPDAKKHLAEVRRLVLKEADYAGADKVCREMQGPYNESYQPLANVYLKFDHPAEVQNYRRELNLDTAVSRVSYRIANSEYIRETFVSFPDQVIVSRLMTNDPAGMNVTVSIESPLRSRAEAQTTASSA